MSCTEDEGHRLPRASVSRMTGVRGQHGAGSNMCGRAEGAQLGLTWNYSAQVIQCLQKHQENTSWNKHMVLLPVDESSVPCWPGSAVTGLSDGPCCVYLEVCQHRVMPEGACTDSRPYQLDPFHPRNCNCGGCGCPVKDRAHFGGGLAVVLILLIVLSTFCTWALGWTS